jgi:hypothetical protein
MNRANRIGAALMRATCGAVAGAVVCLALVALVGLAVGFWPPDDGVSSPLFLATVAVGGTAGAVLTAAAGALEVRGRAKVIVLGAVAGCLLGIVGAIVYGAAATAAENPTFMWDKAEARHRRVGILVGVPAGSLLGGLAGFVVGILQRRRSSP